MDRSSNWLADVAIQQGEFEKARRLLLDKLKVAEASKNFYLMAFCQRSLAQLAIAQADQSTAYDWAMKALDNFRNLDMLPEVEESFILLQSLDVENNESSD